MPTVNTRLGHTLILFYGLSAAEKRLHRHSEGCTLARSAKC